MNNEMRLFLLATVISIGAGAVAAQQDGSPDPHAVFERFDLDGDGQITAEELRTAQIARFEEADQDNDGNIDLDEFRTAARDRAASRAERMFEHLDADGDGLLSLDTMAGEFDRGPGTRMIARFDRDGDGAVSIEEFEASIGRFAGRPGKRGHRGEGPRAQ